MLYRHHYPCVASKTIFAWIRTFVAVENDLQLLNSVSDTEDDFEVLHVQLPGLHYQWVPFGRSIRFSRWYTWHLPGKQFPQLVCKTRP